MKTETAAYASERVKLRTKPRYFVRFYDYDRVNDVETEFATPFAMGAVRGLPTAHQVLGRPGGNTQTVRPETGQSSIGTFKLPFLDLGGLMSAYIGDTAAQQIRAGQRVQLFAGYESLDYRDYMSFAKMEVAEVALEGSTLIVTAQDIQRTTRQLLFSAATNDARLAYLGNPIDLLLAWLLSTGTAVSYGGTVQVTSPTTVIGTSTAFLTDLRVGDYLAISLNTTSAQFARVQSIESNAQLTSSLPLTAGAVGQSWIKCGRNGQYDVNEGTNGLAVSPSLVDVTGLEALRTSAFSGQFYEYSVNGPETGKAWIEAHLRTLNCYPWVKQDGKFSARRYKPAGAPVGALTEDDIVDWQWTGNDGAIINVFEAYYDWDLTDAPNNFSRRQRYSSLASVNTFGPRPAFRLDALGIRTARGGQAILDDRAYQLFKRFSRPPARVMATVFYRNHHLEVGDLVAVTHRHIRNRATGTIGLVAEKFEIIDMTPRFGADGQVVLTLLHTGAQTIPAAPTSDGAKSALSQLVVGRSMYYNAAAAALAASEVETGTATVTLTSTSDTIVINARQFLDASLSTTGDRVVSRLRVGSLAGTLLDGISPPTFVEGAGGKSASVRGAGVVAHDLLYEPNTVGSYTVKMSAYYTAGSAGSARDRELNVAVRKV